jgi:hypothetical protein
MRKLVGTSLVVALLIGVLVGFVDYVAPFHGASKYDPPISEEEGRQLRDLPIAQAEAVLAARPKTFITRRQWVSESIGYSYFWRGVAKKSIAPALGIFISCLAVAGLRRRDRGTP